LLEELEVRLDEAEVATELDVRLEDAEIATELDDLLEVAALEDVALPQTEVVNCALFLPTPAYCVSLSFTHWGVTGE